MTTDTLDRQRDVIDVNDLVEDHLADHAAYCRRLVAARCPEFLPGQVADAFRAPTEPGPGESVWLEVAERTLDAVEALEARLTRIEADLGR